MECLLIFDHLNDIVFTKYNSEFGKHINAFAKSEGFLNETDGDYEDIINDNIMVQIFSPIITSQRIMSCQFGNSYTSIQCENDLNMCFDEYMGYLFVGLSGKDVSSIKKYISICITIVRYLCGPAVCKLKTDEHTSEIVTRLIDNWAELQSTDQAVFIEAVEQLVVNSELGTVTMQALRKSVEKLTSCTDCSKIHAVILVKDKFLSLYSSQNAKELSPADILFCTLLSHDFTSEVSSYEVLLSGANRSPSCLAHVVHVVPIGDGINVLYLLEMGNPAVSSSLYETFINLHSMQMIQIQRDVETLRPAFENLDHSVKKLNESLKKNKQASIENCAKQLSKKWEVIRKKYLEFIKNASSDEALLRAETLALGLLETLKQLLSLNSIDQGAGSSSRSHATDVAGIVEKELESYMEFLQVKAVRNFTLGSDSLTINKYLEEFPGIVHFLYVDRTNHRLTAPTLDFNSVDETGKLTKTKIWNMVNFSRNHLQEGNLSLMWKDTMFNYSYFLWFEDTTGTPLKPLIFPTNSSRALPLAGVIGDDFYRKLKEVCFPKMSPAKIRCYELFCIHLGLVTATCVLEHTRRLAATIWELRGVPTHPIDLL